MARMIAVIVFIGLPQLLAGGDVEERDHKEGDGKEDHEEVGHSGSFYQDPCLPPYHQTRPRVVVSWWPEGAVGLFVTK